MVGPFTGESLTNFVQGSIFTLDLIRPTVTKYCQPKRKYGTSQGFRAHSLVPHLRAGLVEQETRLTATVQLTAHTLLEAVARQNLVLLLLDSTATQSSTTDEGSYSNIDTLFFCFYRRSRRMTQQSNCFPPSMFELVFSLSLWSPSQSLPEKTISRKWSLPG